MNIPAAFLPSFTHSSIPTGGRDRCLRLWRARIDNCGVGDRVHSGGIRGISFAAGGRVLATASEDKTVKVCTYVRTGRVTCDFCMCACIYLCMYAGENVCM
jgi:WD40 repeat protein